LFLLWKSRPVTPEVAGSIPAEDRDIETRWFLAVGKEAKAPQTPSGSMMTTRARLDSKISIAVPALWVLPDPDFR
jgi:hypothetical protein